VSFIARRPRIILSPDYACFILYNNTAFQSSALFAVFHKSCHLERVGAKIWVEWYILSLRLVKVSNFLQRKSVSRRFPVQRIHLAKYLNCPTYACGTIRVIGLQGSVGLFLLHLLQTSSPPRTIACVTHCVCLSFHYLDCFACTPFVQVTRFSIL
jgi:hypothetical protein